MTTTPRYHAFLCHAGAAKPAVRDLAAKLRAAGLSVWIDEEQILPGDSIITSIQEGLAASEVVLVCLSAGFAASRWAQKEWQSVLHQQLSGKPGRVVPVIVADFPDAEIPLFLADLRREDVRDGSGFDRVAAMLKKVPLASVAARAPASRSATTEKVLKIENVEGGLRATWIDKDRDRSSFAFSSAVGAVDMAEHRWYLEEYLRFPGPGDHARAKKVEWMLEAFGHELFSAIQQEGGAEAIRDLMSAPEPRVLTISSKDADALALPWELLRDGKGPLVFRDLVIRRRLPNVDAPKAASSTASVPLRLLLVVARPTDVDFIDPRSSAGPLLDALDTLGGLVRVDLCEPPTLAELERRLDEAKRRQAPYHIVHFDGHGVYLPKLGVGALCFEGADAKNDLVKGSDLGDLLQRMHVPVAVLEACQTADLSSAPVFGSVAPALLKSGVGSVLAFSHAVLVSAARILVKGYYEALCKGDSVGEALNRGRAALKTNAVRAKTRKGDLSLRDWHIAELYQVGSDPVLVPGGAPESVEKSAPLQRGREPERDFDLEPMYAFHGRARELLALSRKLRKSGAVALTGGGGMGKTSLAREAARWWHRIGLRPGGAAFFSFESRQGADRAVEALVAYVEGDAFIKRAPEEQWARAVALFRSTPLLWVWDNFESMLPQYQNKQQGAVIVGDDERDKLAKLFAELMSTKGGGPKGWLLVTCRPEGTGLGGIAEMALDGLGKSEALDMTRVILERKDVPVGTKGYEREKVEEVLDALGGHPLSIELVMPHLKAMKPAHVLKEFRRVLSGLSQAAKEGRNQSLLASLAFSTERLSDEARSVLPYLAWFEEGAFEQLIIDFCQLAPEVWAGVRAELVGTALVKVDDEVGLSDKPYLRFHPTLPYAAVPEAVADREGAAKRFVAIYREVAAIVRKALFGAEPAGGMKVMAREEGNMRRATALALEQGEFEAGARLAETIGYYLGRTGRVRDQARWAAWVQEQMGKAGAGPAKWNVELQHAWGLFLAGKAKEAIVLLEHQSNEIERAGGDARQQALCQNCLGRIWYAAGQPNRALKPLDNAVKGFEAAGDRPNLSAALSDQANALHMLGRHADALASAKRSVELARERGDARSEAVGLGQMAKILTDQHRFAEAEERYQEALDAARRARDQGLEGITLQHMGSLADDQGDYARAVARYREALERFQALDDQAAEMKTAALLGTAEQQLGHYEAARAWYAEAERLARALGDERQLGAIAQNLGILLQTQALALPESAKAERSRLLGEAAASVETSLALHRKRGDEVNIASSLFQLGVIHKHLGALDQAERYLREALAIFERLNLPDVYKVYANLERIAAARGNEAEAAEWRAKKEAKIAELKRLAQGDGPPRLPPGLRDAFMGLCQALYDVRTSGIDLPPDIAEAIAHLVSQPPPLGDAGRFLQGIAGGGSPPPVPQSLPPELAEILSALAEALSNPPS